MGKDKMINTQFLIKTGNIDAWNLLNPILDSREIGAVVVPLKDGTATTLIKVGDGQTDFINLPFVSGLSADVYDWAKAENKPQYKIDEIIDSEIYINKIIALENKIKELEEQLNNVIVYSD